MREVERLVLETAVVATPPADDNPAPPRIFGVSFLHRSGSAHQRPIHLHASFTESVFTESVTGAQFIPGRTITPADIAVLT